MTTLLPLVSSSRLKRRPSVTSSFLISKYWPSIAVASARRGLEKGDSTEIPEFEYIAQYTPGGRASTTGWTSASMMRGRRLYSSHCARDTSPMVMFGRFRSSNELRAMSLPTSSSSMYFPIPLTIDTTVMRNITPMQTPSIVKKLLSFCTRMVARARRMASKKCI